MRAANRSGVVHASFLEAEVLAQLRGAALGMLQHVVLGAELQTSGGTRLDAGRLEARAHAVRTQRALVNLLGRGIEFRDVVGTPGNAKLATNAVFLLEVHDAVGVLHDGAVGGTGA